jgi:hypothetical protein
MHGIILFGFKAFVTAGYGEAEWKRVVHSAGALGWYHATQTYSDQELTALVEATAHLDGRAPSAVLDDFGASLVPVLISMYGAFIDNRWRTLDLLANTETVIHRTVRLRDPTADPPHLSVQRISGTEVHIEYRSQRRLCALAIGICRGVAAHFGEAVTVLHPECMTTGAPVCRIVVACV